MTSLPVLHCGYHLAEACRSCAWLGQGYADQLAAKQARCAGLLAPWPGLEWSEPVASRSDRFRNKAKMVVGGTVEEPTLGILDPVGGGVDLRDCPLHEEGLAASLPVLAAFVARARLTPYDVPGRRGELKHLLVTCSPDGELMVRFVLRSQEPVARIRKHLPWLLERLPVAVASVNLQPEHKAVLEGQRELVLTEQQTLRMPMNGIDLHLRPQSFFQTNTAVGAALYRQARDWATDRGPRTVWDLYSGVGGFALHLAAPGRQVTGVELSAEAVASAATSRDEAGLGERDLRLVAADATRWAVEQPVAPDLVLVNPPRRGIGDRLSGWLEGSGVPHVLYSSCNPDTLVRDLAAMPSYRPVRARVLDMFPQTAHLEVLTLLERVAR